MLKRPVDGCRKRSGFSLVELSVVLVVSSLMLGFGMQAFQSTGAVDCNTITRQQMVTVQTAVDKYVKAYSIYPRPAGRGWGVTSPQFGRSDDSSEANINIVPSGSGNVLYGALPFQTLGLPASFAADCWGNKMTYAVTEVLTQNQNNYAKNGGNITVKVGNAGSAKSATTSAAYVVISHGADGNGAVKKNGGTNKVWNCNTSTSHADSQNCRAADNIVVAAAFNNGKNAGTAYFDDYIVYADKGQTINADCTGYPSQCGTIHNGSPCYTVPTTTPPLGTSCASIKVTSNCVNGQFDPASLPSNYPYTQCQDHGVCGAANGQAYTSPPTTAEGLCNIGDNSSVTTNAATYTWTCTGSDHVVVNCSANRACDNTTLGWVGGGRCLADFHKTISGHTTAIDGSAVTNVSNDASKAANFTGTATATCTGNTWSISGTCKADCALPWGGGYVHDGNTITAYQSSTPAGSCVSETRTCHDGTFDSPSGGNYAQQNCTAGCNSQTINWGGGCSAPVNSMVAGTTSSNINNAASGYIGTVTATCNAGGSISLSSQVCNASCTLPWGGSINHGQSVTAYQSASPAGPCVSETRTCNNGSLGGSYTSQVCTAGCQAQTLSWGAGCSASFGALTNGSNSGSVNNTAGGYTGAATANCSSSGNGSITLTPSTCYANCNLPWGGAITSGQSVTAYQSSNPAGPCVSESRTCTNGSLSGSYGNASCSAACTSTACGTTPDGGSCTSYNASSVACGNSCSSVALTSTCHAGVWDTAPYANASCSVASCNVNGVCGSAIGSCGAGTPNSLSAGACSGTATWYCTGSGTGYTSSCCNNNAPCPSCGPTANNCSTGTASGYNAGGCGGTATWTCTSANAGSSYTTNCSVANASCPVCGGGANSCNIGSPSNYSAGSCGGTATWTCTSGSYTTSCSAANSACVAGVCNNGSAWSCSAGNAINGYDPGCGSYRTWQCQSPNGGSTDNCSQYTGACASNGACGGTVNTCSNGTPSGYNAGSCGGTSTWNCVGSNGGSTASCSAANASCPACGGSSNSCNTGTPSAYNGGSCGGNQTWTCNSGSYTTGCTLANAACASNGACGGTANSCNSGTASGYSDSGCGGQQTWNCVGSNGGGTASCSIANPACPVCSATSNACDRGSPSGYNAGSCGGSQTWTCTSSGYTTGCSQGNPACCVSSGWYATGYGSCSNSCGTGTQDVYQTDGCGATRTITQSCTSNSSCSDSICGLSTPDSCGQNSSAFDQEACCCNLSGGRWEFNSSDGGWRCD